MLLCLSLYEAVSKNVIQSIYFHSNISAVAEKSSYWRLIRLLYTWSNAITVLLVRFEIMKVNCTKITFTYNIVKYLCGQWNGYYIPKYK